MDFNALIYKFRIIYPVGKFAKEAVCRSAFFVN